MNTKALVELGRNAQAFAEAYVRVKEALMREGVEEHEAAETARYVAMVASIEEDGGEGWRLGLD